jgi:hypothetical protein
LTLFEFISVAVSIVLALSAGQILLNLREVFDPTRRYWVHALWVVHALFVHILVWWSLWAYRDVEAWNLATFTLVLLPPGMLFVMTSALVPNTSSSIESWETHFYVVRRWVFTARSLVLIAAGYRTWLLLGKSPLESPSPVSLPLLALLIVGFIFPSRRVQGVVAVATAALLVFGLGYFRLMAGAG